MSEHLHEDGWTLFDVREIEVSNHINGEYVREIVKHERYVKEINGEWFYKDITTVTPLKRRKYIDIDGGRGPLYEWVEDEEKL